MFKHILIPTDGSEASLEAARAGIEFAGEIGARVTGYHAVPPVTGAVYGEGYRFPDPASAGQEQQRMEQASRKYLDAMSQAALSAGVQFEAMVEIDTDPSHGIVGAAEKRDCDAIFMTTHGRRGLARLAHGSVAHQVLSQASIPVVVYR